jgi:hypothetical protein
VIQVSRDSAPDKCRIDAFEITVELPPLVPLAAEQADAFGAFAYAHQREAQFGFLGVKVGIQSDERLADAPGQQRADAGIEHRAPHHVARNSEAGAADHENELIGQDPQNADEAHEQQRRLKQPDAEARRKLGELAGVFFDALVRIGADRAGQREAIEPAGREPGIEQMLRQPLAQPHLEQLLHPGLADNEREQHRDERGEHQQLVTEAVEAALRDGIEERAVPGIEPQLADHVAEQDRNNAAGEERDAQPMRRTPQRTQQGRAFSRRRTLFVFGRRRPEIDLAGAARIAAIAIA